MQTKRLKIEAGSFLKEKDTVYGGSEQRGIEVKRQSGDWRHRNAESAALTLRITAVELQEFNNRLFAYTLNVDGKPTATKLMLVER